MNEADFETRLKKLEERTQKLEQALSGEKMAQEVANILAARCTEALKGTQATDL